MTGRQRLGVKYCLILFGLSRWSILIRIILYNFPESSWPWPLESTWADSYNLFVTSWLNTWAVNDILQSLHAPLKDLTGKKPKLPRQWWMNIINVVHLFTFTLQSWKIRGQQQKGNVAYNWTPISESLPRLGDSAHSGLPYLFILLVFP